MSFLNPLALWFLSLTGVILLFYLLKRRKREIFVSSNFLWQKIVKNLPSPHFQWKLPFSWLLLIQIIILVLMVLALSNPLLFRKSKENFLVIVLDTSASMKSTDILPNRFFVAKKRIEKVLKTLSGNTKIALISSTPPQLVSNFSDSKSYFLKKLKDLEPLDVSGKEKEALNLASSLISEKRGEILFFTDTSFPQETFSLRENMKLIPIVSENPRNIGITFFSIRSTAVQSGEYEILIKIENFSHEAEDILLRILANEKLLHQEHFELLSLKKKIFTYSFICNQKTFLKVELKTNPLDDLLIDNFVGTIINPDQTLFVLLVSRGNLFLKTALKTYPQVKLFVKDKVSLEETPEYGLIFFDEVTPPPSLKGNIICISALAPDFPLESKGWEKYPPVTYIKSSHPLFRFVNLENLNIRRALSISSLPGAEILLRSFQIPLVQIWQREDLNLLFISFDLYDSDFPLQVGFPVFIFNLLQWFHPEIFDPQYYEVRTGENFFISREGKNLLLIDPRNHSVKLEGRSTFSQVNFVGPYKLNGDIYFVANLLNREESNISPQIKIYPFKKEESSIAKEGGKWPLSPLLILLVLLLLLGEWYLYYRGVKK